MVSREEFLERGFVVERGFFSPDEMVGLCDELRTARPRTAREDWLTKGRMIFRSNLFFHDSRLRAFISQQRLIDLVTIIAGGDLWVRWDQAVNKLPGGTEFPWHQDNAYNRLLVPHFQLWIAATPIRRENGGLWLDPGSHRHGLLPHRFMGREAVYQGTPVRPECVEAEAGDVILFSSLLLHYTSQNSSTRERWAYVVEYMSLGDFDPYISPPYFVVARDGSPKPHFTRLLPGRLSLRNQLTYLLPRLGFAGGRALAAARRLVAPP
jgi:ectoine hydroxylase-related dioxygenase (phytanoyl-CoA dioxygenase family)